MSQAPLRSPRARDGTGRRHRASSGSARGPKGPQGDATTLLSWLGIDVQSEAAAGDSSSGDPYGGGSATPPDMNQMPALQLAVQTNGDPTYLMSMLGHDIDNEQAQA